MVSEGATRVFRLGHVTLPLTRVNDWQEAIATVFSVKLTLPVGAGLALEVTVAVKLTLSFTLDEVGALELIVTVGVALPTVCVTEVEVSPL
jgi:hypothetical protein